ncbi:tripartite motif-containing protein 3-like [Anneissia japonica]|uniref:tripartite motif-containing protein 3-like n=1 Tax=Anneissia japonica TaxID=1529436 RepID=UPI001425811F|nr:tripartite motif-containing protein 3-like [Anneissia japonica]
MVNRMHQIGDGDMLYSDYAGQCVVMCDEKFQKVRSFGKRMLKYPKGLTLNKETRTLYVADYDAHCVYTFNVDDGRMLGKIGLKGSKEGGIKGLQDVTLTKEGHVIVAEFENDRIQTCDANHKFMRILVDRGQGDGKVFCPCGVAIDMDENIIISSNDKLQLFGKNSVFIKRIDHEDDGLDTPVGIAIISNRPRRVAVANYGANNIKIFNY